GNHLFWGCGIGMSRDHELRLQYSQNAAASGSGVEAVGLTPFTPLHLLGTDWSHFELLFDADTREIVFWQDGIKAGETEVPSSIDLDTDRIEPYVSFNSWYDSKLYLDHIIVTDGEDLKAYQYATSAFAVTPAHDMFKTSFGQLRGN